MEARQSWHFSGTALHAAGVSAEHNVHGKLVITIIMLHNPDEYNVAVLQTVAVVGKVDMKDPPVSPTVSPDAAEY